MSGIHEVGLEINGIRHEIHISYQKDSDPKITIKGQGSDEPFPLPVDLREMQTHVLSFDLEGIKIEIHFLSEKTVPNIDDPNFFKVVCVLSGIFRDGKIRIFSVNDVEVILNTADQLPDGHEEENQEEILLN